LPKRVVKVVESEEEEHYPSSNDEAKMKKAK